MKISRRRLVQQLPLSAALAGRPSRGMAAAKPARVLVGPTISASAFRRTIGIGAHWDYKDTVYGRQSKALIADIVRLGIRHVRGYDPTISPVLAKHGVSAMLVAGPEAGLPDKIAGMVLKANARQAVIDAVEGPNEADLFWPEHHYSYLGKGFPAGVLAYQRDLFAAIRAESKLNGIVVIGPSLGRTYDPGTEHGNPFPPHSLANAVTYGNFHPYPFGGNSFSLPFPYDTIRRYYWNGNFPSVNLDEYPYEFKVYAPPFAPKLMAATETGYPTWRNGISEFVQAKYIPRLFAEYCRLGIQRTYLYELVDIASDPSGGNMNDHFGLIRNDMTVKPAFSALQSLLALTAPNGLIDAQTTGPSIRLLAHLPAGFDRPQAVHSLVVRRSTNEAILLIWHEVASMDTASDPPRTINVPVGSVDMETSKPWSITGWSDYGPVWDLKRHTTINTTQTPTTDISVPLRDQIVTVRLRLNGM